MRIPFHNKSVLIGNHTPRTKEEFMVALLGPVTDSRVPFGENATITDSRGEIIDHIRRLAPENLLERLVLAVPEYLGNFEGDKTILREVEEATFGHTPIPPGLPARVTSISCGIENWKTEVFELADLIAVYFGYERGKGDNGRFEAGVIAGKYAYKSLLVVPQVAKGGTDQALIWFLQEGGKIVGTTAEEMARAIVDAFLPKLTT